MNCYNHPTQTAVAQCVDCGKGLCSQCASMYSIPICSTCNKQRITSEKGRTTKELLVTFILGGILTYLFVRLFSIPVGPDNHTIRFDTPTYIILFYICAGVVAGWQTLTKITPQIFLLLPIIGWLIYFAVKLFLSFWLGLVMLPIRTVRNIFMLVKVGRVAS